MAATKFTKDSVVCFFGDSITAHGGWIRRIYDHYRLEEKIPCKMFNCGVGGDSASKGVWRLEETVLCYQPTDVVIAFGMNDSGYWAYNDEPLTERGVLNRRRMQDNCISSLRMIAAKCLSRNIRVTLCTPTVPDEWKECEAPVFLGVTGALVELSLRIRALAEELGVGFVDFTVPFRRMAHKLNAQGYSLVGPDRVHPVAEGHELMAKLFLGAQGFAVDIPETWEQLQTLAALPHDQWEDERYRLELEANATMFVEWNYAYGKRSQEAIDQFIADQLQQEQRISVRQRAENYAKLRDLIPARRKALVEHTNTVK